MKESWPFALCVVLVCHTAYWIKSSGFHLIVEFIFKWVVPLNGQTYRFLFMATCAVYIESITNAPANY